MHSFLQPLDHRIPMVATEDIAQTAVELLRESWKGVRIVEVGRAGALLLRRCGSCTCERPPHPCAKRNSSSLYLGRAVPLTRNEESTGSNANGGRLQ